VNPMTSGERGSSRTHCHQSGVMFLGLLAGVALFGLGMVGIAKISAAVQRADKERELVLIGHQYKEAIKSYYNSGPNVGMYPPTLEDLLQDKRSPTLKRHLRRIYADPITGKKTWGFVKGPAGGIMGVYSLSEKEPQKRASFEPEDSEIEQFVLNKLKNPILSPANASSAPASAPGSIFGLPGANNALTNPAMNSSLKLTPQSAMTTPVEGEAAETVGYSYKDWKFIYRPVALSPSGAMNKLSNGF